MTNEHEYQRFLKSVVDTGLMGPEDDFSRSIMGQENPGMALAGHIANNRGLKWLKDSTKDSDIKGSQKYQTHFFNKIIGNVNAIDLPNELIKAYSRSFGKKISPAASKAIIPILMRMGSENGFNGLDKAVDYALSSAKGLRAIKDSADSIFGNKSIGPNASIDRESTKNFINNGALDGQLQAISPVLHNDTLANYFPEHNLLLNAARSRVSNYLKSQQPMPLMGKTFDPKKPHPMHHHNYDLLIDMAHDPLSISNSIRSGRLTPKDLSHFKNMYPEIHDELSKHITRNIIEHQLEERRPSHKIRQSLSLFMGTDLDSSLSPENIMAAQATFVQQAKQRSMKEQSLKNDAQNAMTDEQAREKRLKKP